MVTPVKQSGMLEANTYTDTTKEDEITLNVNEYLRKEKERSRVTNGQPLHSRAPLPVVVLGEAPSQGLFTPLSSWPWIQSISGFPLISWFSASLLTACLCDLLPSPSFTNYFLLYLWLFLNCLFLLSPCLPTLFYSLCPFNETQVEGMQRNTKRKKKSRKTNASEMNQRQ